MADAVGSILYSHKRTGAHPAPGCTEIIFLSQKQSGHKNLLLRGEQELALLCRSDNGSQLPKDEVKSGLLPRGEQGTVFHAQG